MSDYAIRAEGLGKSYQIGAKQRYKMLRDVFSDSLGWSSPASERSLTNFESTPSKQILWALRDISFEIPAGQSVGVIGSNGAGKSTLLKVLARVTAPTEGKVRLRGRVGSLLEVGTGFHPELTGRENVYLNGAVLGMRRHEIDRKFDEIVSFSEIETFLDTAVKFYSSGMRMRLAFSVAAYLEPEILLVDEILAVGDLNFQRKSLNKMSDVVGHGRTVVFVSHNMAAVRALCGKAIYIDKGKIRAMGDVTPVLQEYLAASETRLSSEQTTPLDPHLQAQILSASIMDCDHQPSTLLPHDRPFYIRVNILINQPLPQTYVAMKIHNQELETSTVTYDFETDDKVLNMRIPGQYTYDVKIPAPFLIPGNYTLGFEIMMLKKKKRKLIHKIDHAMPFEIFDNGSLLSKVNIPWNGAVHLPITWEQVARDT